MEDKFMGGRILAEGKEAPESLKVAQDEEASCRISFYKIFCAASDEKTVLPPAEFFTPRHFEKTSAFGEVHLESDGLSQSFAHILWQIPLGNPRQEATLPLHNSVVKGKV
ncbi:hypothetical protein RUM43_012813 [Polyplax serrata]|uniref:Uncharacterized protein n=1 Tax=Polyplax serrata TaxID=468196 RepID=A0AAN8Q363_POLSC